MSDIIEIRIFISSPSDLLSERIIIKNVIADLNNTPQYRNRYKLTTYAYEDSAPALIGLEPQHVIDKYMLKPEDADIFICMLWLRMGTPMKDINPDTGEPYQSGTEYEFLTAYRAYQQRRRPSILLYHCRRFADPEQIDPKQLDRVNAFFKRFKSAGDLDGLVGSFREPDDLKTTLWSTLTQLLDEAAPMQSSRQAYEREHRLLAVLADHSGFIRDRLDSFVGREKELAAIHEQIKKKLLVGGYITITGQAGQGKSSIIAKLVEFYGIGNTAHHFIPFNPGPDHQVSLLRNLMARLILKYNLSDIYIASESRPSLRDFFPKVLAELVAQGGKEIIFIDGLDQLQEDANGERDLSFLPTRLPPGVVCVLGTRPNDTLKPLELLKPHYEYQLPELSRTDFDLILERRNVLLDKSLVDRFYKVMQANALYLDLAAKELAETKIVGLEAVIYHLTDNPENIFSLTMERLKRQREQWQKVIKPVLGLLLAAQVPLRQRAIRDLIGVDSDSLREGLRKLGGLVAQDGQGRYQLFHLKLRDYLRQNEQEPTRDYIFDSDEEQKWHLHLSSWCMMGVGDLDIPWKDEKYDVTEQDRRLYARDHYITHLYFAKAWTHLRNVIDEGSYGKAKLQYDPSTRSFAYDLELSCRTVTSKDIPTEDKITLLPKLWQYILLRSSLVSKTRSYPDELFALLVFKQREREALELVELLPKAENKVVALYRIGEALAQYRGRDNEALLVMQRAESLINAIENKWIRAKVHLGLVERLAGISQWDEAIRVAYKMGDSRDRVKALATIAEFMSASGEKERFSGLIEKFARLTLLIGYKWEHEKILDYMNEIFSRPENWESIANLVWQTSISNERQRNMTMLAKALVGLNQLTVAKSVAYLVDDVYYKLDILLAVARQLAKEANYSACLEIVEQIISTSKDMDEHLRTKVLIPASLLLASMGKQEVAIQQLTQYSHSLHILTDDIETITALIKFAEDVAEWEEQESAKTILLEASSLARTIYDMQDRTRMLRYVADALARLGEDTIAVNIYLEAGAAPLVQFGDLDTLLEVLLREGQIDTALNLLTNDRYLKDLVEKKKWQEAIDFARGRKERTEIEEEKELLKKKEVSGYLTRAEEERLRKLLFNEKNPLLTNRIARTILIVESMLRAGERIMASQLLKEAIEIADHVKEVKYRAATFVSIIQAAAKLDSTDIVIQFSYEVLNLMKTFQEPSEQLDTLYKIVAPLEKVHQSVLVTQTLDKLLNLLSESGEQADQGDNLRKVAKALAYSDKADLLIELIHSHWLQATTRDRVLQLLPMASGLIAREPKTISLFMQSFTWVDTFIKVQ